MAPGSPPNPLLSSLPSHHPADLVLCLKRVPVGVFAHPLILPRLVVGAPLETNGHQKTGDVYKCPVLHGNCTKLNLGEWGQLLSRTSQGHSHTSSILRMGKAKARELNPRSSGPQLWLFAIHPLPFNLEVSLQAAEIHLCPFQLGSSNSNGGFTCTLGDA